MRYLRVNLPLNLLLGFLFLILSFWASALDVPSVFIPASCSCSPGTSASFGVGSSKSEVFLANCWCPPQNCVASWSTASKFAGVSLACNLGQPEKPVNNCVDFTNEQARELFVPTTFGSFVVHQGASAKPPKIDYIEMRDGTGNIVDTSITSLITQELATITLPNITTHLVVNFIPHIGSGFFATWLNGKGVYKSVHLGVSKPEGYVYHEDIDDPDGFRSITLKAVEVGFLNICTFY
jgi:hypothetical protein